MVAKEFYSPPKDFQFIHFIFFIIRLKERCTKISDMPFLLSSWVGLAASVTSLQDCLSFPAFLSRPDI